VDLENLDARGDANVWRVDESRDAKQTFCVASSNLLPVTVSGWDRLRSCDAVQDQKHLDR
jgi:hypothetical protein